MEIAILLFYQIIMMFTLILAGYMLFKLKIITKNGSKEIGGCLLYLVVPAIIIKSLAISFSEEKAKILFVTFVIALLLLLLSMLLSHIFLKKDSMADFACAFSNAGFIGIALVQAAVSNEAVFFITSLIALLNFLQWTYGVFLITKDPHTISLKKLIINPVVIAFFIGMFLFFMNIKLPQPINGFILSLSNLNTPLAMIVLGVYLAQADLKMLFTSLNLYKISIIRLIIIPIASIILLYLIPIDNTPIKLALLIAASAPCGANAAIFAEQFNKNYTQAVLIVCLTTILSIITLPLIVMVGSIIL